MTARLARGCGARGAHPGWSSVIAEQDDLDDVARVIAESIDAWPTSARLKRCALPVLAYRAGDLLDHEVLLVRRHGDAVAVAAWQPGCDETDPDGGSSSLLHGLYVAARAQSQAIGTALQAIVAERAVAAGVHGLHVKAERFAASYFQQCGYLHLDPDERPGEPDPYPYRFWQSCAGILTAMARGPIYRALRADTWPPPSVDPLNVNPLNKE